MPGASSRLRIASASGPGTRSCRGPRRASQSRSLSKSRNLSHASCSGRLWSRSSTAARHAATACGSTSGSAAAARPGTSTWQTCCHTSTRRPRPCSARDKFCSVVLSMTKASSGVASATAASNCCSVLAASADRRDISGPSFRTSRADRTAQRPVAGWEANSSSCDKRVSGSGQANGGLTSTAAGFGPDACGATALGKSSKIASPGGLPFFSPSSAATAVPALANAGPAAGSGLGWDTDSERD